MDNEPRAVTRLLRGRTEPLRKIAANQIRCNPLLTHRRFEPQFSDTLLADMNAQLREWIAAVANRRVHGTTREQVAVRWDVEQFSLQSLVGRPSYPYVDGELRKVARDAYIDWQGSRYSVPWQYVGKEVWVREMAGEVDVLDGRARIAVHTRARRKHDVVTFPPHHQGIPLGTRRADSNILIQVRQSAPIVERRSLLAYESAANGGGR